MSFRGSCLWCFKDLTPVQALDGFCSHSCFQKRLEKALEGYKGEGSLIGGATPLMLEAKGEAIARRKIWRSENPKGRGMKHEF